MNIRKTEIEVDLDVLYLAVAGLSEAADLCFHGFEIKAGSEAASGIIGGNAILARLLSDILGKASLSASREPIRFPRSDTIQ